MINIPPSDGVHQAGATSPQDPAVFSQLATDFRNLHASPSGGFITETWKEAVNLIQTTFASQIHSVDPSSNVAKVLKQVLESLYLFNPEESAMPLSSEPGGPNFEYSNLFGEMVNTTIPNLLDDLASGKVPQAHSESDLQSAANSFTETMDSMNAQKPNQGQYQSALDSFTMSFMLNAPFDMYFHPGASPSPAETVALQQVAKTIGAAAMGPEQFLGPFQDADNPERNPNDFPDYRSMIDSGMNQLTRFWPEERPPNDNPHPS